MKENDGRKTTLTQVMIRMDKGLLEYVESYVKNVGGSFNRSAAINMMLSAYRDRDELERVVSENNEFTRTVMELNETINELRGKVVSMAMGKE